MGPARLLDGALEPGWALLPLAGLPSIRWVTCWASPGTLARGVLASARRTGVPRLPSAPGWPIRRLLGGGLGLQDSLAHWGRWGHG
ncbi:MAG: hypothetical protein R3185_06425, partial [Candidatus Thermoplasmatota archaeon]|nr:hypothetical protein [Candidatus Thermoplasmatota archaeon]